MTVDEAGDVQRALDEHYAAHPEARPSLAEIATAMADMDGNPVDRALIVAAGTQLEGLPGVDGDDVLGLAEQLAAG